MVPDVGTTVIAPEPLFVTFTRCVVDKTGMVTVNVPVHQTSSPELAKYVDVLAVTVYRNPEPPDAAIHFVAVPVELRICPLVPDDPVPSMSSASKVRLPVNVPPASGKYDPTAVSTKAVVAICVVLVPAVAVGASGVPLSVGLAARTTAPVPVVPFERFEAAGWDAVNAPVLAVYDVSHSFVDDAIVCGVAAYSRSLFVELYWRLCVLLGVLLADTWTPCNCVASMVPGFEVSGTICAVPPTTILAVVFSPLLMSEKDRPVPGVGVGGTVPEPVLDPAPLPAPVPAEDPPVFPSADCLMAP